MLLSAEQSMEEMISLHERFKELDILDIHTRLEKVWHEDLSERFRLLKNLYIFYTPKIIERQGRIYPYFIDWVKYFTPIERMLWGDIRSSRVSMYPQYPVLNYFLDFADPYRKIGIEADGKEWHNEVKDRERDNKLFEAGWTIFRVTGRETFASDMDWENYDDSEDKESLMFDWLNNTSEGVVAAIESIYYLDKYSEEKYQTLCSHNLQPSVRVA